MAAAYVQHKTGTAASSTTLDVTFDSTTTSGNALFAFSASANGAAPTLTITDENSNTWSNDVSRTNGTDMKGQISSAPNITGGTTHWVRLTSSASRDINLAITEASGMATSSILDKTASQGTSAGAGGTFTSTATTTTAQADEFLVGGLYINNNVAVTFSAPLTERSDFTSAFGDRMGHATGTVASTGTYACAGTCATWENYVALIATYKAAAAGGVSGTIAVTLSNFTSSIAASGGTVGSMAVTLSPFTSAISGTKTIIGTIAQTLASFTSSISGLLPQEGTMAAVLGSFTSAISGTKTIVGTIAVTLSNFTSNISGTVSGIVSSSTWAVKQIGMAITNAVSRLVVATRRNRNNS